MLKFISLGRPTRQLRSAVAAVLVMAATACGSDVARHSTPQQLGASPTTTVDLSGAAPQSIPVDRVKAFISLDDVGVAEFLQAGEPATIEYQLLEVVQGLPTPVAITHTTSDSISVLFGLLPSTLPADGNAAAATTTVVPLQGPEAASDEPLVLDVPTSTTIQNSNGAAVDSVGTAQLAITDIVVVARTRFADGTYNTKSSIDEVGCSVGDQPDQNVVAIIWVGEKLADRARGEYASAERAWKYDVNGLVELDASEVTCELTTS